MKINIYEKKHLWISVFVFSLKYINKNLNIYIKQNFNYFYSGFLRFIYVQHTNVNFKIYIKISIIKKTVFLNKN